MKGDIKNEATVVYHFSCFSLILHHSLHLLGFHPHSPLYCLFRHYASWSYNIIDKMLFHLHCTLPTLFGQIALFQPLHLTNHIFLRKISMNFLNQMPLVYAIMITYTSPSWLVYHFGVLYLLLDKSISHFQWWHMSSHAF